MPSIMLPLLAAAAVVSATGCVRNHLDKLLARVQCADDYIAPCLRAADLRKLEAVESCMLASGCSTSDARSEGLAFISACSAQRQPDLKRQNDQPTLTPAPTTSSPNPTSTPGSITSPTNPLSASSHPSNSIECSTTSTHSVSACSVSNGKTITCTPTTSLSAACAPGVICFTATPGACMRRDDSLNTSGFIVAIVFGTGLLATGAALVFMCVNSSRQLKRKRAAAALLEASGSKKAASDFNIPLMQPGGVRSETYNDGRAPKLHRGLSALS